MSKVSESFHNFFDCWLVEQNHHLQELISAAEDHHHGAGDAVLRGLLRRVVDHYEYYYQAKSRWAHTNALSMFNPSWLSSLEDAFLWIGGWRPTMAFHLLYSKSGLQLEARLDELIQGISITTGDLSDLSPSQLRRVDELQRETIAEEKVVNEKLAKQQEAVADATMVELAHTATVGGGVNGGRVESALGDKEEGMAEILQRADDLRLKTLKSIVLDVLSPVQAVHFLIAAAALHLRVHEWGKKRDTKLDYVCNDHH